MFSMSDIEILLLPGTMHVVYRIRLPTKDTIAYKRRSVVRLQDSNHTLYCLISVQGRLIIFRKFAARAYLRFLASNCDS